MQDMQVATRRFRLALAYLWAWAAAAHLTILAVCIAGVELSGRAIDRTALVCLGILPLAYWVVYGLKFRLAVSPCGLGWVNRSGVPCFLPWEDVARAERQNQFGLPVLAIWSATCDGPFTFPLCLISRGEVREAVRVAAGETHPVTAALPN